MAVAGPVAKPHLSIISTGNKHLAGWHANLAFKLFSMLGERSCSVGRNFLMDFNIPFKQCSRTNVVHVQISSFA